MIPGVARARRHRDAPVRGLRPASESVDLERGVITVDWKVVSGPQRALPGRPQESESSIREITIDDYTIEVLREWRGVKKRDRRAAKEVEPPNVPGRFNRGRARAGAPAHRPRRPRDPELTEQTHIADYRALLAALADLRRHGVRVAVDDVGAGYSSLRHVLRLSPTSRGAGRRR